MEAETKSEYKRLDQRTIWNWRKALLAAGLLLVATTVFAIRWRSNLHAPQVLNSELVLPVTDFYKNQKDVWGEDKQRVYHESLEQLIVENGFQKRERSNGDVEFVGRFRNSPEIVLSIIDGGLIHDAGVSSSLRVAHVWNLPRATKDWHEEMEELFMEFDRQSRQWVELAERKTHSQPEGVGQR